MLGEFVSYKVNFDSNVWEEIVDEEKRTKSIVYQAIYDHIFSKKIQPFFFEGIWTYEAIKTKARKDFFEKYQLNYKITVDSEVTSQRQSEPYTISHSYLAEVTNKAFALGFRILALPRIGAMKIVELEEFFAEDTNYSLGERIDRSHECAGAIEDMGCGQGAIKKELGDKSLVLLAKENQISSKKFGEYIAEMVDGDAVAATYGYGVDYFCTNDQARGAGNKSIFANDNMARLNQQFPIDVVSPEDLLKICENE